MTSALNYLIRAKQNCQCYMAFHQHTQPKLAGCLAYLVDTNVTTNISTMILDCKHMETTLLDYSHPHFATAQGSPFKVACLSNLLQYNGLTPFGDMQGRVHLKHLPIDEPMQSLLAHLKDKTCNATCHHPLVYNELQNG